MNDEEKIFLTKEQAIECLIIKDGQVHNFVNSGFALLGADWDIKDVEECFDEAGAIEVGGKRCRALNHGIVAVKDGNTYFFEADNEKLNKYDK